MKVTSDAMSEAGITRQPSPKNFQALTVLSGVDLGPSVGDGFPSHHFMVGRTAARGSTERLEFLGLGCLVMRACAHCIVSGLYSAHTSLRKLPWTNLSQHGFTRSSHRWRASSVGATDEQCLKKGAPVNPWLSAVSCRFRRSWRYEALVLMCLPRPLPTASAVSQIPGGRPWRLVGVTRRVVAGCSSSVK